MLYTTLLHWTHWVNSTSNESKLVIIDYLYIHMSVYINNKCVYHVCTASVLYENIDQPLPNKLHGPMHYTIGVTCVYNGHMFYTLL